MSKHAVNAVFIIYCSTHVVISKEKNEVVGCCTGSLEGNEYNI